MEFWLPSFIEIHYSKLKASTSIKEENVQSIVSLFDEILAFLGKFCILEYAQADQKSDIVNYHLFKISAPDSQEKWICLIYHILKDFSLNRKNLVLAPLETIRRKYFSSQDACDLKKLLWLSRVSNFEDYSVSLSDIQESQELIIEIVENLKFFEEAVYKESKLIFGDKQLDIAPFGNEILNNEEDGNSKKDENHQEIFLKLFHIYFQNSYERYKEEIQGNLDFEIIQKKHLKHYKLLPWIEIELEEIFSEVFQEIYLTGMKNIILIEGYPCSGKSALAASFANIFKDRFADMIFQYFMTSDHPSQDSETFQNWLTMQLASFSEKRENEESLSQILVTIDGTDAVPREKQNHFFSLLQKPPYNKIIFIVFRRTFESLPFEVDKKISLNCYDNIFLDEYFTKEYTEQLLNKYVKHSSLALKIFQEFVKNPKSEFSVVEIAEKLEAFTPKVLKQILKMKPLFQVNKVSCTEKYSLYHPIFYKILGKMNYF